jgi:hypothetical protein
MYLDDNQNKNKINMKKIIFLSAVSIALLISACNKCSNSSSPKESTQTMDTTKLKTGDVFYQCEMDREVLSDKPGTCSKCGMNLSKVTKI